MLLKSEQVFTMLLFTRRHWIFTYTSSVYRSSCGLEVTVGRMWSENSTSLNLTPVGTEKNNYGITADGPGTSQVWACVTGIVTLGITEFAIMTGSEVHKYSMLYLLRSIYGKTDPPLPTEHTSFNKLPRCLLTSHIWMFMLKTQKLIENGSSGVCAALKTSGSKNIDGFNTF